VIISDPAKAVAAILDGEDFVMFNGSCFDLLEAMEKDLVNMTLSSPPYFMGKSYDRSYRIADFKSDHKKLIPEISRTLRPGGSVCWQVGYHVQKNVMYPLDYAVFEVFETISEMRLRNRIVWSFGHGTHSPKRFCGRHENVLWFTKGEDYFFNLDAVRIPQKYPGKRHYKGPKKGDFSGNPLGKNPSDVWDIPNVKANHVEKTAHPCQFPIALCQRLIRALTKPADLVFDPFSGAGSAGIAAILDGRRFIGAEISRDFCEIAEQRYQISVKGGARYRPLDRPIFEPSPTQAVARRPEHFA
jgi:adenine-specific DNA-methyltransferase